MLNRLFFVNLIGNNKKTVKIIVYIFLLVLYLLFLCDESTFAINKSGGVVIDKQGGKFVLPPKYVKAEGVRTKTYIPNNAYKTIIDSHRIIKSENVLKIDIDDENYSRARS